MVMLTMIVRIFCVLLRALERESEVSRKAKAAAGKAKQAMAKVESEYNVGQRAKNAARKTVGAETAKAAEKV